MILLIVSKEASRAAAFREDIAATAGRIASALAREDGPCKGRVEGSRVDSHCCSCEDIRVSSGSWEGCRSVESSWDDSRCSNRDYSSFEAGIFGAGGPGCFEKLAVLLL